MGENFTREEEETEYFEVELLWGLKDIDRTGEN